MKKRILCVLLAVCLLAGCLPLGAGAEAAGELSLAEAVGQREEALLLQSGALPLSASRAGDAAALVSYIQENGERDSDGDQYIEYSFSTDEAQQSVARIFYIPSYNEILFLVYHVLLVEGQQVTVGSTIGYDLDTHSAADRTVTVYIEDEEGNDHAALCTSFDVRTYTEDTQLRFAWEDGSPETSGFQEMCNSIVNLSVLSWELTLEQLDTGVTLPDLGFVSYFAESSTGFVDVKPSDYFYDAVNWAVEKGITAGTDASHFSPKRSCTRAQAVVFLWRAAGEPEPQNTAPAFTDVASGAYYKEAVSWAVENGITAGTSKDKFSPEATCTRAQIVSFLYRAAGSPEASAESSFSDVKPGAYYENAVRWAVENKITTGTSKDKFSPNAQCIRGQVVSFLYRYCA